MVNRYFISDKVSKDPHHYAIFKCGHAPHLAVALMKFDRIDPLVAKPGENVQLNLGSAFMNDPKPGEDILLWGERWLRPLFASVEVRDDLLVQFKVPAVYVISVIQAAQSQGVFPTHSDSILDSNGDRVYRTDDAFLVVVRLNGVDENGVHYEVENKK